MNRTKLILIILNLVFLLGYFNWSVFSKEKTLESGRLVLLELAPVDPRSLMQGDYMRLRYKINNTDRIKLGKRGFCILKLDTNGVAQRIRFQGSLQPLQKGEFGIKYFSDSYGSYINIHVGAESYFFEEGAGERYEAAKYGGLKIDEEGNSVLTGLYNEQHHLIR